MPIMELERRKRTTGALDGEAVRSRRDRWPVCGTLLASVAIGCSPATAPSNSATTVAAEPRPAEVTPAPASPPAVLDVPEVVIVAGQAPRIGSVEWNPSAAPAPGALPRFAMRAILRGAPVEMRHVVLRWIGGHGAWYLGFLQNQPDDPCDFRWFREPGFRMRLRDVRPSTGTELSRLETGPTVTEVDFEPDLAGAVDIFPDPIDENPYRMASGVATSIVFDRVDDAAIEGRVYVAGRTSDHLLVGAFRGSICPVDASFAAPREP